MKRPDPIKRFKKIIPYRRPAISEVVREPTAGGIVYRYKKNPDNQSLDDNLEILLIQDAKNRWTIPKGHIEEGETAKQTAEREIQEETGLREMKVYDFLGKIHFQYRRQQSLVLMTTDIFLVEGLGDTNALKPEEWMNDIRWFPFNDAIEKIEYEDISKLMLIAKKKIRESRR